MRGDSTDGVHPAGLRAWLFLLRVEEGETVMTEPRQLTPELYAAVQRVAELANMYGMAGIDIAIRVQSGHVTTAKISVLDEPTPDEIAFNPIQAIPGADYVGIMREPAMCGKDCGEWEVTVDEGVTYDPPVMRTATCKLPPDHEGPCMP